MKKNHQRMSSSSTLPLTILILAFLSLPFGEHSCSDDFARLIHKRHISNCKALRTLGAEFGWNYHNGTNSTILIDILFGTNLNSPEGWIAWGINPGKRAEMIGTKALIGIKHSDGTLKVDTYDITRETKNGCKLLPSPIGIEVLNKSIDYDEVSRFYTISARLVLPSEEYNITKLNHVWQVGHAAEGDQPKRHPTTLHNVDSTETIDLTSSSGISTGQDRSYLRSVHGVLNIIGWGTMLPIGVIIARYFRVFPFKSDPMWFYLHIACQLAGFLIGTAGWIIGLSLGHASRYYTFHIHRTFGIFIFTFSTIQMLAFRLKPKETDDYRKYWNMYHHFLGYGLVAIIAINIFKGISILKGGEGWRWAYIVILSLLGAIVLALEISTWVRFFMAKFNSNKEDYKSPKPPIQNSPDMSNDPTKQKGSNKLSNTRG